MAGFVEAAATGEGATEAAWKVAGAAAVASGVEGSEAVERKVEWTAGAALQVGHLATEEAGSAEEDPWEEMTVAASTEMELPVEDWSEREPTAAQLAVAAGAEPSDARWQ
jgi:hypothetical protein